jgi:hypothetical protein
VAARSISDVDCLAEYAGGVALGLRPRIRSRPFAARAVGFSVVERRFNKLKQWRGIAMRSDKLARNYHTGLRLAATPHWLTTGFSNP